MGAVAIVDTSIFCNILDIPGRNKSRAQILRDLKIMLSDQTSLLLPMAAIYETGNHIAQLANGGQRRQCALRFVEQVQQAIAGNAPWQVIQVPNREEIAEWLVAFPDSATRGAGMGDLSMVKEWEKLKTKVPGRRIFIWSLDRDLQGYDYCPS